MIVVAERQTKAMFERVGRGEAESTAYIETIEEEQTVSEPRCVQCEGKGVINVNGVQTTCPLCKGGGLPPGTATIELIDLPINVTWNGSEWVGPGADVATSLSHPERLPGTSILGPGVVMSWPKRLFIRSWSKCRILAWSTDFRKKDQQHVPVDFDTDPTYKADTGIYLPSLRIVKIANVEPGATIVGQFFREKPEHE